MMQIWTYGGDVVEVMGVIGAMVVMVVSTIPIDVAVVRPPPTK